MLKKILILTITLCCFILNAQALKIDKLYFIGDSLADQGNCNIIGYPPSPITNGNTFAYYLGNHLEKSIFPSGVGGTDYACIAASTGYIAPAIPFSSTIVNGNQQIQQLLQDNPTLEKNSLFVYWLGSDDILLSEGAPIFGILYPPFNANTSTNFTIGSLNTLHNAGANYIVVVNLSPLEKTPDGLANPARGAAYKADSELFNQMLLNKVKNIGYEVIFIDLHSIYNYVTDNFRKYGFTNITDPCSSTPGVNCETAFYFNDVHPTDKAHRLLADAIFSILSAPDFFGSMGEVPFSLMQNQYALIRQQLYPQQQNREAGKIYPFVGGTWSPKTQPALGANSPSYSSENVNGTVGVLSLINENFLIGGAFGVIGNTTNYDQNGSNYRTNANVFSLFASYQKAKFYANAIVDYAKLKYNNIERKFYVGPVMTVAEGNTEGDQRGVAAQIGYNFWENENFQTGPLLSAEFQALNVNGYTENTGTEVFDVAFDDQSNTSSIGGIGWQATFNNKVQSIPVTTNAFVMLNKQFAGDERAIYFRQAIVPIDFASLPVERPRGAFASAGINFAATFKHGLLASLGYLTAIGDNDLQSHVILASLSIPL